MRALRLALLLGLAASAMATKAVSADPDYAATGSVTVDVSDVSWTDAARGRDIPLRVRLPRNGGHLPTILFSHGLGGSVGGGAEWGEQWASRGFAVIHVQHPGSDELIWKNKPVGERIAGFRSGADLRQFTARIADIKFVLDELERRQAAGDAMASRLDLRHVGMSGHSFGAVTTLYLGGQRPAAGAVAYDGSLVDKRFVAFLAFSPQAGSGADAGPQFAEFRRPALLVTGTLDGPPFPGLGASVEQRLIPFEAMAGAGNKFLLVVDQADHMFFNGTRGVRDIGAVGRGGINFSAVEDCGYPLVKAISTAYWLAYLGGDSAAGQWLKGGSAAASAATCGYLKEK